MTETQDRDDGVWKCSICGHLFNRDEIILEHELSPICDGCKKDCDELDLTTPHALMRGIPHPHGLGFLLRSQSQRPDSAGLTSHLSDGTVLQIQKPATNNSLTNKMKNIKRNKCLTSSLLKQGALQHGKVKGTPDFDDLRDHFEEIKELQNANREIRQRPFFD